MRSTCMLIAVAAGAAALSPCARAGGPPVPAKPPPPVSGWLFDDGSGTTAADTFASSDGELQGGMGDPNWVTDVPQVYPGNTALAFDGGNDRILVSETGIVSHADNSTVAAWFWWDDPGSDKEFAIFDERDECGFNIYALTIERRPGVDNGLSFAIFDRGSPAPCGFGDWQIVTTPIDGISTEAWHHAAGVLDETGGLRLYLDGELVATDPDAAVAYSGPTGQTTIGHLHLLPYDSWWSGQLDEIAVFATALSDEEILWLYENTLGDLLCPADIDGDGDIDVTDFLALLAAWGPNPGHPADLNGDGVVDVVDFLELLSGWGAC